MVVEPTLLDHPTFFTNCSGSLEGVFRICPAGWTDSILAYDRRFQTLVLCQVDELDEEICSPVVGSFNGNRTITLSFLDQILNLEVLNELNA